jgi:hypothetical protein
VYYKLQIHNSKKKKKKYIKVISNINYLFIIKKLKYREREKINKFKKGEINKVEKKIYIKIINIKY